MKNKNIKLGTRVKDVVTGLTGIAVGKVEYLNGCIQYMIKPKLDKDGNVKDASAIDSQQLEIVDKGINKKEEKEKKSTGGIMPDTPKL